MAGTATTGVASVVGIVTLVVSTTLLVLLMLHTGMWGELMQNHLTDGQYDSITGDVLEVQSVHAAASGGGVVVFGSDVVLDGAVSFGAGDALEQITTRSLTVEEDVAHETVQGQRHSLVSQITSLLGECTSAEDLAPLQGELDAFEALVAGEAVGLTQCLADNETALAALSSGNEAQLQDHVARLDAAESASCGQLGQQASNATVLVAALEPALDAINVTIVAEEGQLANVTGVLDDIDALLLPYSLVSCNVNASLLNSSIALQQSLSAQLASAVGVLGAAQSAGSSCLAAAANLTAAVALYSPQLAAQVARGGVLAADAATHQSTFDSLNSTWAQLAALFVTQNGTTSALSTLLAQYQGNATALAAALTGQWTTYGGLAALAAGQTAAAASINSTFASTYALFNATYGQCASGTALMVALQSDLSALQTLYATTYGSAQASIMAAQSFVSGLSNAMGDVATLEGDVVQLSNDSLAQSTTLAAVSGTVGGMSAAMTSASSSLDSTQLVQFPQVLALLAALETLAPSLATNTSTETGVALADGAALASHLPRIQALELNTCNASSYSGDALVRDPATFSGWFSELTTDNFAVSPVIGAGDFPERTIFLNSQVLLDSFVGTGDVNLLPSVVVDRTDHSYMAFRNVFATVGGVQVYPNTTGLLKVSPVNGILWMARVVLPGANVSYVGQPAVYFGMEDIVYMESSDLVVVIGLFQRYSSATQSLLFFDADGTVTHSLLPTTSAGAGAPGSDPVVSCVVAIINSAGHWTYASHSDWALANGRCVPYKAVYSNGRVLITGLLTVPARPATVDFGGGMTLSQTGALGTGMGEYTRGFWAVFDPAFATYTSVQQYEYASVNELYTRTVDVYAASDGSGTSYLFGIHQANFTEISTMSYELITPTVNVTINHTCEFPPCIFAVDDMEYLLVAARVDTVTGSVLWMRSLRRNPRRTAAQDPQTTLFLTWGWDGVGLEPVRPTGHNAVALALPGGTFVVAIYDTDTSSPNTYTTYVRLLGFRDQTGNVTVGNYFILTLPQYTTGTAQVLLNGVYDTSGLIYVAYQSPTNFNSYVHIYYPTTLKFIASSSPTYVQTNQVIFAADNHRSFLAIANEGPSSSSSVGGITINTFGIVRMLPTALNPYGMISYTVGSSTNTDDVTVLGMVQGIPGTHGTLAPGAVLYNEAGVLVTNPIDAQMRMGISLLADQMLVSMRKPRIVQV